MSQHQTYIIMTTGKKNKNALIKVLRNPECYYGIMHFGKFSVDNNLQLTCYST